MARIGNFFLYRERTRDENQILARVLQIPRGKIVNTGLLRYLTEIKQTNYVLNTYQLIIQIYSYFILKIKIKYITSRSVALHFQYINDEVECPFITEGEGSFSI